MTNNFFNDSNKAYSENLNDGILVGNAFDWTVDVSLPTDTGGVFPNSSTISMAKVADVYISPNSNLSIGSSIENSSGSSQVYRLTVYPNFNRYGGFKSISLTADSGVTFYVANKGASTPIANNLDYSDLSSVPELKVLKEYDIVLTIPNGKSVSGLEFVFQSSSADVSGSISQSNVTGLEARLSNIESKDTQQDVQIADLINAYDEKWNYKLTCSHYNPTVNSTVTVTCRVIDFYGEAVTGESVTLYCNGSPVSTSITNNQGLATWTVTVDTLGLNYFSVGNYKLAINVIGWREVTLPSSVTSVSDCHLYVNDALRICDFKYYRTNYNFTSTSSITLHNGLIPQTYRPLVNVICASFNDVIVAGIVTDGSLPDGSLSVASSETGSKNINISAMWHY